MYGRMVKFSHTLFALPFALSAYAMAGARYGFSIRALFWIFVAMVSARSSAMIFNRIVDRDIDALNPRTADRELPSKNVSLDEALVFLAVATAIFVYSAYSLNFVCFILSPVALAIVWGYSFIKRFSWGAHFILGLALAVSPVGAWLAAGGRFEAAPFAIALAVIFWVAGFDIIYACQDAEFDAFIGIKSIPACFGIKQALRISSYLHLITLALFVLLVFYFPFGWIYGGGLVLIAVILIAEHLIITPNNLSKLQTAFFTLNATLSIVFFLIVALDIIAKHWI